MGEISRIVNVNQYELKTSADEYRAAITALAARTESEGHAGVVSYQWFVDRSAGTAGAVIVYADAEAWLAHHRMAYEWPEMPALQATVTLTSLTMLGPTSPEIDEFFAGASLPLTQYREPVAGFDRG